MIIRADKYLELKGGEILDIGCGRYKMQGAIGIDADPALAKLYKPDEFILHDLNLPLPFDDGSMGFVMASHILEHFPDPLVQLKEIHRVLKAGGLLRVYYPIDDPVDTQEFVLGRDCGHRIVMNDTWFEDNQFVMDKFEIVSKEYIVNRTEHRGKIIDMRTNRLDLRKK